MRPKIAALAGAAALVTLLAAVPRAPAQTGSDAAAPAARGSVLLAFLPQRSSPRLGLLDEFERRGMTIGLASPTLGGFTRRQMVLDISQGARISSRAYDERVPSYDLELAARGGGRIGRWDEVLERAEDAPGDLVPGLLAEVAADAGLPPTYLGGPAPEQVEAAAAAGRDGRIGSVELLGEDGFAERLTEAMAAGGLVVTRLPFGSVGLEALDAALAARGPRDLVVVMRAPPGIPLQLVPVGIAGGGFGGGALHSDTTRRDGLISATDIAPTILDRIGAEVPEEMDGRILEPGGGDAANLRELADRLDVINPRRGPVLRAALAGILLLFAGLWFARRRAGVRTALRLSLLGALWMPGVALLTAALSPAGWVEIAALTLGSLALAAATDRLAPWPLGPAVPAAVVLGAHTVDLAFGSPLIGTSLAGPNPKGGARFFGIGNELEILLSLTVLIGAGAALAHTSGRRGARLIVAACVAAGIVIGAGRLGADVGGVITLGAGAAGGGLAMLAAAGRLSRRALALALAAPVAAVAALVVIDLATGGGAHLTRSVLEADSSGDLLDVVERRIRISFAGLEGRYSLSFGLAVLVLVAGVLRRRRVLAPGDLAPGLRAGIVGAFAATVVGSAANDSGPIMLMTGTVLLALAAGYLHGRPSEPDSGTADVGLRAKKGQAAVTAR